MRKTAFALILLAGLGGLSYFTRSWIVAAASPQLAAVNAVTHDQITVHAAGRGYPSIDLCDGLEIPTVYAGDAMSQQLLNQGSAQPRTLASADFDEDGLPDLVCGYAAGDSGILTLYRGNVDSIYPNSPEAQQRKIAGAYTDSAFLHTARSFAAAQAPDFLVVGEFDADGHSDVVTAARGSRFLYLLPGDGRGDFGPARRLSLPGVLTALVSGDINRADGLMDLVVGVVGGEGPKALVFESPDGAFNAEPESFSLPAEATAISLGRFDDDYLADVVFAAGRELIIARGRDRKLSFDASNQAKVRGPEIEGRSFGFDIKSIAAGDFTGNRQTSLALLSSDGTVYLTQAISSRRPANRSSRAARLAHSQLQAIGGWKGASDLLCARVSGGRADDLLTLDRASRALRILVSGDSNATLQARSGAKALTRSTLRAAAVFDLEGEPVAVLPMRLNSSPINDLVVLQSGHIAPAVAKRKVATTFVVNKTDDHNDGVCDSGDCTLREAIEAANSNPGSDSIAFSIPGAGVHTISVTSTLPTITDPVMIDGTTQAGFAGSPIIELNGNGGNGNGLSITAGSTTVRGFVINRFFNSGIALIGSGNNIIEGNFIGTDLNGLSVLGNRDAGIAINNSGNNRVGGTTASARNLISGNQDGLALFFSGAAGNVIEGNFIGTNVNGNAALGNSRLGIFIALAPNNLVGGTTVQARNVISGNSSVGIQIQDVSGPFNRVQGNFIGTDVTGTAAMGNSFGIFVAGSPNNTIGGTVPGARNLISGASEAGIFVAGEASVGTLVQGNYIGTDVAGTSPLGNFSDGVFIIANDCLIGGTGSGAANIIAFNAGSGVSVSVFTRDAIRRNSIFSNGALGIDLADDGVTPNDPCDGDAGSNNFQNSPSLTAATSNGVTTTIQGTLNSTPNTMFSLEFFANAGCDPSGFGQGQTFLGSTTVTTDGNCNASFNTTLSVPVGAGQVITATATDPGNNTSEFSACAQVIQEPAFNLCLQDESNGNILLFNSTTGAYQFTSCRGSAISGTGTITVKGCLVTLQVNGPDRRVLARLDTCAKTGIASIQILSQGSTFSIMDRNTGNNTCACSGGL